MAEIRERLEREVRRLRDHSMDEWSCDAMASRLEATIDSLFYPHPEAREEDIERLDTCIRCAWNWCDDSMAVDYFREALSIVSRLAAPKPEARTISWQLINDIIDETLEEEAAPLECAIQVILAANGYTAINEPTAPEPRRAEEPNDCSTCRWEQRAMLCCDCRDYARWEPKATSKDTLQVEPAPAPSEGDALSKLDAIIEDEMVCNMGEGEPCLRCDLHELVQRARIEKEALRSQLSRKDEGLMETMEWAEEKLSEFEINTSNYTHDDVCRLDNNATEVCLALRAALREPDGRKGE